MAKKPSPVHVDLNTQPESRLDLDRLIFFSDGVFAIAITLLALDLRLPELPPPVTSRGLARAIVDTLPRFVPFVISFQVIGIFWLAHHRTFGAISRFDRRLAMLNLLHLLCIVFMPFPTSVIGHHGYLTTAAVFYSGSLVATSLTSNLLWRYAVRRQLLDPNVSVMTVRAYTARGLLTLVLFLISVPLAFVSTTLAEASWVSVALVHPLAERWARRRTR